MPVSIGPQPEGRSHNLDEFVRVAGTKDASDAQLSNLDIRNRDVNGAVSVHLDGRILEWRLVELDLPPFPRRDATQLRPIHGRRPMPRDGASSR